MILETGKCTMSYKCLMDVRSGLHWIFCKTQDCAVKSNKVDERAEDTEVLLPLIYIYSYICTL